MASAEPARALAVLMIEDDPGDAKLVERALRTGGMEPSVRRVDSRDAFVAALQEARPDVILADYHVPGFDGLAALRLARELHPEVPVITVTGALNDEAAVELLHEGAQDYVLKDRLSRLGSAVRRAIERAQQREEKMRADAEARLLARFPEENPNPVMRADASGALIYGNPASRGFLEAVQGVIGRPLPRALAVGAHAALASGVVRAEELRLDGHTFLLTYAPLVEHAYVNLYAVDVTGLRKAEEEAHAAGEKLLRVLGQTIDTVALAVEKRDPYTAGHQQRVARLCEAIGRELRLPEGQLRGLRLAASIHDIGKVYVPAEILARPGKLLPAEFDLVKEHALVGHDIVKGVEFPWPVAEAILQHHERLDGSGYPRGLRGEQVILEARILAVADIVDAMSSHRPYRPAAALDVVLKEIETLRGAQLDERVADACLRLFRERGFRLPGTAA